MNLLKKLSPRMRFCVLFSAYIITLSASTYSIHRLLQEVLLRDKDQVATFNDQIGEMVGGLIMSSVSFYRQAYTDTHDQWQRISDLNENMKKMH